MSFGISTNIGAMAALQSLQPTMSALSTSQNRISTGVQSALGQDKFTFSLDGGPAKSLGGLANADLDMGSSSLAALQTKQQIGVQSLTMANSTPQALMALFRG